MTRKHRISFALATLVLLVLAAAPTVKADSFTFAGTFTRDDDLRLFAFTVGSASVVTLQTTSYARGGFDPALALFQVSPPVPIEGLNLIAPGVGVIFSPFRDGAEPLSNIIIADGEDISATNFDDFLQLTLNPGLYILSLTQFDNFAIGPFLEEGFSREGQPNFRAGFTDAFGNRRGNFFELRIDGPGVTQAAQVAAIPEPTTLLLLGTGLAGIAVSVRRRRGARDRSISAE